MTDQHFCKYKLFKGINFYEYCIGTNSIRIYKHTVCRVDREIADKSPKSKQLQVENIVNYQLRFDMIYDLLKPTSNENLQVWNYHV